MSVQTKTAAMSAPGNSSPMGNIHRAAPDTPAVPITVIMLGVTGVRASACPTGLSRRAIPGRRKLSMAVVILPFHEPSSWQFRSPRPVNVSPLTLILPRETCWLPTGFPSGGLW